VTGLCYAVRVNYRAVIFDLGHTIWGWPDDADAEPVLRRSYGAIAARLRERFPGVAVPGAAALRRAVARALKAEHEAFLRSNDGLLAQGRWDEARLAQPSTESLFRALLRQAAGVEPDEDLLAWIIDTSLSAEVELLRVAEDAAATLRTLTEAGVRAGAVTNTYQTERGIRRALRLHGIEPYFSALVVSSEAGYRKPHRALYLLAADRLGMAPEQCLYVGDRLLEDVLGPKAVGMKTALCHRWRQEPPGGAPDYVIAGLSELPDIVLG
jgi:HAD superfamily hydrolase (TIGR01662 family)